MLYKLHLTVLLSAFITLCFASSDVSQLAPGLYRIVNPDTGSWARNLPGPGHQGPWISTISMTKQFSSVYQTWHVTPYEEGYRIRNYGSRNSAFSTGKKGDPVQGFSDGLTKWYIEAAGGKEYRVHYPNKDLVWTVQSNEGFRDTIYLEPATGEASQTFEFTDFQEIVEEWGD